MIQENLHFLFLKFVYGNVSQTIESIFKNPWKPCVKWKLANYVSVIDESWDVVSKRGVWPFDWVSEWDGSISVGCLPWSHCLHRFIRGTTCCSRNFASTPNASAIASTPNTSTTTIRASRNLSRRALACVKVRSDFDNNRKPSNLRLHNHTVHVNIYTANSKHV